MRVLYVIHDFLPRHAAGSQVYAHDLAQAVMSRGHPVHFFASENFLDAPRFSVRERETNGLPVTEVTQRRQTARLRDTFACQEIEERFEEAVKAFRPDVVHYHHLLHLSLRLPERVPPGVPQIFTLHDYWLTCPRGGQRLDWTGEICREVTPGKCARCMACFYDDISLPGRLAEGSEAAGVGLGLLPKRPFGGALRGLARSLLRHAPRGLGLPPKHSEAENLRDLEERDVRVRDLYKRIDRFIAPSPFLAERLEEAGLPGEKLLVSDYGFAPLARKKEKKEGTPLRVGYVGTLVPHKGVHQLVEAMGELGDLPVELSLHGDPRAFPSYTKILEALARKGRVVFEGGFDPGERQRIYENLDLLVLPALWWENSPLTIHEAHLLSVPVLVPRHGALPHLVEEGKSGFFYEPGSAASLASALRTWASDAGFRAALIPDAARIKPISKDAEWTLALYEQLGKERRDASA